MTEEELDLVETEHLVAALRRRSSASLICLCDRPTDNRLARQIWYDDLFAAIGLAVYAQRYIINNAESDEANQAQ